MQTESQIFLESEQYKYIIHITIDYKLVYIRDGQYAARVIYKTQNLNFFFVYIFLKKKGIYYKAIKNRLINKNI